MTILVTGATGTVGGEVVRALARSGQPTRALVRDPSRISLDGGTVTTVRFDWHDPSTFDAAFEGGTALFSVTPLVPEPVATARAAHAAAVRAGVSHVVRLSSRATGWDDVSILRRWHRAIERDIELLAPTFTHLRPCSFFQNLRTQHAAEIRARDRLVMPLGDGLIAFVDAVDIGEVGATCLLAPETHAGKTYVLTGPSACSGHELASAIGASRGRPVQYVPADPEASRARAAAAGVPDWLIDSGLRIFARAREGGEEAAVDPSVAELLGRPARSLAEFVAANADAFRSERAASEITPRRSR